jgi:hypothetical protein
LAQNPDKTITTTSADAETVACSHQKQFGRANSRLKKPWERLIANGRSTRYNIQDRVMKIVAELIPKIPLTKK